MSYWVYLENSDGPVEVESHSDGGTYALGGTTDAELNVTYNYGWLFRAAASIAILENSPGNDGLAHWRKDGLRALDGELAGEAVGTLDRLTAAFVRSVPKVWPPPGRCQPCEEEHDDSVLGWIRHVRQVNQIGYWSAEPMNAALVVAQLAEWARQHPDASFRVS